MMSSIAADFPGATPDLTIRKRVLLVDASSAKRELRAEAMRKLGMYVDCAADISEARCWWKADLYNLVLINLESERGHRDKFCDDIRSATPPQQLAFLVGKPEYLANIPNPDGMVAPERDGKITSSSEAMPSADDAAALPFGIMEASRRISAVRSASVARTTAMRNRPTPPRDHEIQHSRHADVNSQISELLRPQPNKTELQKEEML